MQDFLLQCRKTGYMGIAGPAFVKTQTGFEILKEHGRSVITGVARFDGEWWESGLTSPCLLLEQ